MEVCTKKVNKVQVYMTPREKKIFVSVRDSLGESDTGIFLYLLKAYADSHNLI